jgi:hypothetical protein
MAVGRREVRIPKGLMPTTILRLTVLTGREVQQPANDGDGPNHAEQNLHTG